MILSYFVTSELRTIDVPLLKATFVHYVWLQLNAVQFFLADWNAGRNAAVWLFVFMRSVDVWFTCMLCSQTVTFTKVFI